MGLINDTDDNDTEKIYQTGDYDVVIPVEKETPATDKYDDLYNNLKQKGIL